MKGKWILCGMAASLWGSPICRAATIHVPADRPTIQSAISFANNNDLILVSPGTYNEAINLLGKTITVRSTGGANVTTINASAASTTVVVCNTGETQNTILDGFTLTGGIGFLDGGIRHGGGMWANNGSSPTVLNCIIRNNSAGRGGAIYCALNSSPRFLNCAIHSNSASTQGGAIYCSLSSPSFTNCTLTLNSAASGGGVYKTNNARPAFTNSIMWNNSGGSFGGDICPCPVVNRSDVQGGIPNCDPINKPCGGVGNLNTDPVFVNAAQGDLRLVGGSPCIDAGDSTAIAEMLAVDLNGSPRGVNDPNTPDTGVAVFGLTVDMGAYEFQTGAPPTNCPADVTGDKVVNVSDLLQVIGDWGACP